jgi:hypothetical protein
MMTLDQLRAIALALPGAEERETWGEITFRVRDKIYVICASEGERASVRTTMEEQAALTGSMPETFSIAPYTGRYGWTAVHLASVELAMMAELITDAWRRTAPKRLAATLDAGRTAATGDD